MKYVLIERLMWKDRTSLGFINEENVVMSERIYISAGEYNTETTKDKYYLVGQIIVSDSSRLILRMLKERYIHAYHMSEYDRWVNRCDLNLYKFYQRFNSIEERDAVSEECLLFCQLLTNRY